MAKFILLIFALQTIIYVPFSRASDEGAKASGNVPKTVCAFGGSARMDATFKLTEDTISLIPDRCEVISYGYFRIDNASSISVDDQKVFKCLTSSGHKVWTFVSYYGNLTWGVLMDASPASDYEAQMTALTTFITDYQIGGIILDMIPLFDSNITDFACKMNEFICKLKQQCPGVLVGVVVSGVDYKTFQQGFDLKTANEGVDFYFVDMYTIGNRICAANTTSIGILPLTSNDTGGSPDMISLDTVTSAIKNTDMDPSKTILNFVLEARNEEPGSFSYTEYCCQAKASSKLWCADSLSKCYKEGAAAKDQSYSGICMTYLDFDDYAGSCGCGYFPVTQAFIDGFETAEEPCCASIDTPKNDITKPPGNEP